MKSSSVVGTPVRKISNTAREGMNAQKPKGMSGTVNKQFEGDQTQNRASGATGTPYTSQNGNSDEFKRTVSRDRYGKATSDSAGDQQNPHSNGTSVLLGGVSRDRGYEPAPAPTMDSPVPSDSPTFNAGFIQKENLAHLGEGKGVTREMINDDLINIGGVMSRGMRGTSTPTGPENELTDDDTLRGDTGSSMHEKE